MNFKTVTSISFTLLSLSVGCERPAPRVRSYLEIGVTPEPPQGMANTPVPTAPSNLAWTAPAGWAEQPGGKMRLATFLVGPEGAECAITVFPGDVGGLTANLRRWLGQLKVEVPNEQLAAFAAAPETIASEGGLNCQLFDFAPLLPPEKNDSLVAAIVPLEGQLAFVKLTGSKAFLAAEKDNFRSLCRSLKP